MKKTKFIKLLKAFFVVAILLFSGTFFAKQAHAIDAPVAENTFELCHDGIDNDGNFAMDASDAGCIPFYIIPPIFPPIVIDVCPNLDGLQIVVPEGFQISEGQCVPVVPPVTDVCPNIEGDQESVPEGYQLNEGQCVVIPQEPSEPTSPTTPTTPEDTTTHSSTHRHGGSGVPTGSSVLGASTTDESTSCTPYIFTYMKFGQKNNVDDVKRLQTFLNKDLGTTLPITGFFGKLTEAAVKQFQTKYATQILKPWVDAGLATTLESTGYVYKTTLWFINTKASECGDTFPFPALK